MVRWCVNCWQGRCCEFDYRRRDPKNGCSPNPPAASEEKTLLAHSFRFHHFLFVVCFTWPSYIPSDCVSSRHSPLLCQLTSWFGNTTLESFSNVHSKESGLVCAESNLMKPCLHVALITFKYLMCQSQLLTSISFAICWILHCVVIWGMEACMSNYTTC